MAWSRNLLWGFNCSPLLFPFYIKITTGPKLAHKVRLHFFLIVGNQESDGREACNCELLSSGRGPYPPARSEVPAGFQRSRRCDLQSATRRHRRTRWHSSRSPHHRDQWRIGGGSAPRLHRQSSRHGRRGDLHSHDTHFNLPIAHWTGDSALHLGGGPRPILTLRRPITRAVLPILCCLFHSPRVAFVSISLLPPPPV